MRGNGSLPQQSNESKLNNILEDNDTKITIKKVAIEETDELK